MEALVKVLDRYVNEFPEDTLLEIPLLKICGRMGDMEIRACLHWSPMITWNKNWGDIIGCIGVLVWMLSSGEGEYGGLYMIRWQQCDF